MEILFNLCILAENQGGRGRNFSLNWRQRVENFMTGTIWAPWRMEYIKSVTAEKPGCFLCDAARDPDNDEKHLVVARTSCALLMLNRYPYVNGHMLVAPYAHVAQLGEVATDHRAVIMELALHGQRLLEQAMNPQGFNIGFNIGRCAGAGVPGHIHMHIVPRWNGDINFMTTVGQVRVIPQALEAAYEQLRRAHLALGQS
jgi:ATP adenylyltransferase